MTPQRNWNIKLFLKQPFILLIQVEVPDDSLKRLPWWRPFRNRPETGSLLSVNYLQKLQSESLRHSENVLGEPNISPSAEASLQTSQETMAEPQSHGSNPLSSYEAMILWLQRACLISCNRFTELVQNQIPLACELAVYVLCQVDTLLLLSQHCLIP